MNRLLSRFAPDKLGGQSLIAFAIKGLGAVVSFALTWLIARAFGSEGAGLFGLALSTTLICSYTAMAGFDILVVRKAAGDLRVGDEASAAAMIRASARIVAVISVVITVGLFLLAPWLAGRVFDAPASGPLLAIIAWVIIPTAVGRIATSALRVVGSPAAGLWIDGPVQTGLAAAIIAGLLVLNVIHSPMQAGYIIVGCYFFSAALGWFLYLRKPLAKVQAAATPRVGGLIVDAAPFLIASLSNLSMDWLSNVMISSRLSVEAVGLFRVAGQIVSVLSLVQVALDSIVAPRIAGLWRVDDRDGVARVGLQMAMLAVTLASPLVIILLVFPEFVLGIFGPEFTAAAPALRILAISGLIRLGFGPIGSALTMSGSRSWVLGYSAINVAIFIPLVLVLIGYDGINGAAWAVLLTVLLRSLTTTIILRRVFRVPVFSPRVIAHVVRRL